MLSGGMDSATLLWHVMEERDGDPIALSFHYGQRHSVELDHAWKLAELADVEHHVIDLRTVGVLLHGSSLIDMGVPVPDGHYAEETMKATVVPNRNAMMLNIGAAVAIGNKADKVYAGMHAGDHPVYPDCRPEFVEALNAQLHVGTEDAVSVEAPFIVMTKADICKMGAALDVPFGDTWSCYKGNGPNHCGRCGTCTERIEAFRIAGVPDPTTYDDMTQYEGLRAEGKVEA